MPNASAAPPSAPSQLSAIPHRAPKSAPPANVSGDAGTPIAESTAYVTTNNGARNLVARASLIDGT